MASEGVHLTVALTPDELQVPPTEAELSNAITVLSTPTKDAYHLKMASAAIADVVRRLAFQQDRLKKDLQDIQARLILCEEVAGQLYSGAEEATATTGAYYRKFPEDFEDEQKKIHTKELGRRRTP